MQELDTKAAEVEKVLQPLIKAGTVIAVRGGWAEGTENRETNLPVGKYVVTVAVMSDHPEQLYPEIRRMVEATACYGLSQSRVAARQRTPMKLEAVFS
jgi:hypothetical protein